MNNYGYSNNLNESSPMMSNTNTPADMRNNSPQRYPGNNDVTSFNPNGSNMKPDNYYDRSASDQNTAFSNKYDAVIEVVRTDFGTFLTTRLVVVKSDVDVGS